MLLFLHLDRHFLCDHMAPLSLSESGLRLLPVFGFARVSPGSWVAWVRACARKMATHSGPPFLKKRAHWIKHRSQYIKYITPLQHPGMVPSAVSGRDREQDLLIQCVGRRLGSWFLNARTKEPTEKMFYSFSVQTPLLSSLRSADFCSFSVGSHSFHHVRCPFPAPRAADRSRSCVPIRLT